MDEQTADPSDQRRAAGDRPRGARRACCAASLRSKVRRDANDLADGGADGRAALRRDSARLVSIHAPSAAEEASAERRARRGSTGRASGSRASCRSRRRSSGGRDLHRLCRPCEPRNGQRRSGSSHRRRLAKRRAFRLLPRLRRRSPHRAAPRPRAASGFLSFLSVRLRRRLRRRRCSDENSRKS